MGISLYFSVLGYLRVVSLRVASTKSFYIFMNTICTLFHAMKTVSEFHQHYCCILLTCAILHVQLNFRLNNYPTPVLVESIHWL